MSELLHDDETWMRELLAPLERMEPVELPARASRRPRVLRRPLAVAACVVAALVLATGIAVAADVNPFSGIAAFAGIGAVDHPPTAEDALSPTAAARLQGVAAFEKYLREHGKSEFAQVRCALISCLTRLVLSASCPAATRSTPSRRRKVCSAS